MAQPASRTFIPPQSIEAEQSVLGAMMLDRNQIAVATEFLKSDYFYKEAHATIYEAIEEVFRKNEPVDIVTVREHLEKTGALEKVGGGAYLTTILDMVPSPEYAEHYGKIVESKFMLRQLINASNRIAADAYEWEGNVADLVSDAAKSIHDIGLARSSREIITMKSAVKDAFRILQERFENRGQLEGVSSGFIGIDTYATGFKPGELIILAARPGMGKTSLALNICENVALREKKSVGFFSLEMSAEQLVLRMVCSLGEIDATKIKKGFLIDKDWDNLGKAFDALRTAPMSIVDSSSLSATQLRAKALRMAQDSDTGLDFMVIDYLQLMTASGRRPDSRVQEISEITRQLKLLARELEIPILCLSQLSRQTEAQRGSKKPQLSHLRDSGSIEQDADIVMFIYRPDYYEDDTKNNENGGVEDEEGEGDFAEAEVRVAKNRNGPTGTAKMTFMKYYTRFYDAVLEEDY